MSDPWIVTSSCGKPDAAGRQLIRSHVMRGVNSRQNKRAKKQLGHKAVSHDVVLTTPRKIANELSLFGFNVSITPEAQQLIFRGELSDKS